MPKSKLLSETKVSRRKEYADRTRLAIISAARKLFASKGYAATRVEEIASLARVAPITVYTVVGGKTGLLRILMDIWITAPIIETALGSLEEMTSAQSILETLAQVSRSVQEDYGDIMYVMLNAAPHDQAVAECLAIATTGYRRCLLHVAQTLENLHALRPYRSLKDVADSLWFYFGYWSWHTLQNENRWKYEKAEQWLVKAATQTLLQDEVPKRRPRRSAGNS